jgi:hypothetical protein
MSMMKKQMKANPQTPGNTQSDTYENTEEKGYDNEDEARAAPKEINEFLENHQQSKEEKELEKQLEACKLKSYDDAHKIITELKECSLTQNNSEPSDIICRVRILIANQASEPNTYL